MSHTRPSKVDIVAQEPLYQGYSRLDRYRLRHELYAGGMSQEVSREILERGHATAVILWDPQAEKAVMIEQFRPGAYGAGWSPWLLEIVAGIIDPGETPEEVCRREALEEAGIEVSDLFRIQAWLASPGISTESIELWCGRVDSSQAGGIHGLDHEGEDIRVAVFGLEELRALLDQGALTNATTVIAVQWLLLNQHILAGRWQTS